MHATRQHYTLNEAELSAFGAELDALRKRVLNDLGEKDARYIREIVARARLAEVSGRALLCAGLFPPAWVAGVALLSVSKVLENMEIGHNVLHGQYDWLNEPTLKGATYEWDWACPAAHWRHSHNFLHHAYTNIVGKDRDVGYGLLRMADAQPWHPVHTLQPVFAFAQMLTFEWAVAVHDLEVDAVVKGDKTLQQLIHDAEPVARKLGAQLLKDFVWFPLLAGPAAPAVFTGNLSANLVRNVWAFLVIFCGHFPDGVEMFESDPGDDETRAAWYLRQIRGSANCRGPGWFHVLSGHLSHQIEHHLFPDIPAPRYPEVAREVEAICARYGVPYNSASFPKQIKGALARVLRGALPSIPERIEPPKVRLRSMPAKIAALRSQARRLFPLRMAS